MRVRENFELFDVVLLVMAAVALVLGFETVAILAALGALLAVGLGQLTDTEAESSKPQESVIESSSGQSTIESIQQQYAEGKIGEDELERQIEETLETNDGIEGEGSERNRDRLLE